MRWRTAIPCVLGCIGAVITLGTAALHGLRPGALAADRLLLGDAAVVALVGAVSLVMTGTSSSRWSALVPWLAVGALLGAAAIGRWRIALWLFVAAVFFLAAGAGRLNARRSGIRQRFGAVVIAAVLNIAVLWALLMAGHTRDSPDDYLALDLRAHELLADVPLHDVWVFRLEDGGEGRTIQDVRSVVSDAVTPESSPIVLGLFRVRRLLGDLFGWDAGACDPTDASYVHRLDEADRSRSLVDPGSCDGLFRTIYVYENEAVTEATNNLVHSFSAIALVPTADGYELYMGVYVKRIGWMTPIYMAVIDPFRRLLIYPDMVSRLEKGWAARWAHGYRE